MLEVLHKNKHSPLKVDIFVEFGIAVVHPQITDRNFAVFNPYSTCTESD